MERAPKISCKIEIAYEDCPGTHRAVLKKCWDELLPAQQKIDKKYKKELKNCIPAVFHQLCKQNPTEAKKINKYLSKKIDCYMDLSPILATVFAFFDDISGLIELSDPMENERMYADVLKLKLNCCLFLEDFAGNVAIENEK